MKTPAPRDASVVTTRRQAIHEAAQTAYWLVGSAFDLAELLQGRITEPLRRQAIVLLHRGQAEGDAEYGARRAQEGERVP